MAEIDGTSAGGASTGGSGGGGSGAASGIAEGFGMLAGGIIGNIASKEDRQKAQAAMQQAVAEINSLGAPINAARQIILDKFESAGILTPAVEQEINLGVSKLSQIQDNENLKQAQLSALDLISQRAKGGLTPEDKAALNQARLKIQTDTQAQQQSIMQSMQQRGMGGSGAELAARLSSSQAGAQQASQESDRLAAMASQNALSAAAQSGQLAGSMQQAEFQREADKAQAADTISRFNVENAISRQQRNIGAENQARQYNLTNAQDIANRNVSASNAEKARYAQAYQQGEQNRWNQEALRAQLRSGAQTQLGKGYQTQAENTQKQWSDIGTGAGKLLSGVAMAAGACYANGTELRLPNGSYKDIADIEVGEELYIGGKVLSKELVAHENFYLYKGVLTTKNKIVFEDGEFIKVQNSQLAKPVKAPNKFIVSIEVERGFVVTKNFIGTDAPYTNIDLMEFNSDIDLKNAMNLEYQKLFK